MKGMLTTKIDTHVKASTKVFKNPLLYSKHEPTFMKFIELMNFDPIFCVGNKFNKIKILIYSKLI